MTNSEPQQTDIIKSEWLQLLEFIKRKQGEPRADFIKRRDYNNRGIKSVPEYYNQPHLIQKLC